MQILSMIRFSHQKTLHNYLTLQNKQKLKRSLNKETFIFNINVSDIWNREVFNHFMFLASGST